MKIAFVSELPQRKKVPRDEPNLRTEFAWMVALDADHYNIVRDPLPSGYDLVIVIIPKGELYLNTVGIRMEHDLKNPTSQLLHSNLINDLKVRNTKVGYVQEGPNWLFNDYSIDDQFAFYGQLADADIIFAHNLSDQKFYRGMFPGKQVNIMRTLMLTDNIGKRHETEDKTFIGGNFAKWYGGFQSFVVAQQFGNEIWCQDSHAKQQGEDRIEGLNHYSRMSWIDWIHEISRFKYAVHLMPTVAAGTFSLNCAYWGIPCIGNFKVDTQQICFPDLSVDIDDIASANESCTFIKDASCYSEVSEKAQFQFEKYYSEKAWKKYFDEQI
jgi:hypothetical protein